jgi:hypothetical protein
MIMGIFGRHPVETAHDHGPAPVKHTPGRLGHRYDRCE